MKNFAYGFSPALLTIASKHRPLPTPLTYEQIILLSTMSGYDLVDKEDGNFTLYHPDHKHGLDRGLTVVWHVRVSGKQLIYTPYVQPMYIRGNDSRVTDGMEEVLSTLLSTLGFKDKVIVDLPEPGVYLPQELRHPGTHTTVMFLSEFKKQYRPLYLFMKSVFE